MERVNIINMKDMTEKKSTVLQKKSIKRQYSGTTRKLEDPPKENQSGKKKVLKMDKCYKRRRIENGNSVQTQFGNVALQRHDNIPQHNNNNSSTSLRRPSIQNPDQYLQDFKIDQKNGGTLVAPNILGSKIAGDVTVNLHGVSQVSHCTSINKKDILQSIKNKMKSRMMKESERILEGSLQQSVSLNKIYTQLFIINDESDPINKEHEIWQIETTNDLSTSGQTVINYNEILKLPLDENRTMKIVLTKGIAGIGKTVTVQKFVHDWASGKANQDLELVFLLPFRELNLREGENQSLFDLLCAFYSEFKEARSISDWICDRKVLFILDGLDEYKNELSFQTNILSDVTKKATLDVLLANLLRGKLLPSAHLWITSRPVAAEQLPSEIFRQGYVTQIRGFTDEQKEEYFTRQFEDPDLTQKVIGHLKSHKSLWILCHIPLFCWISSVVLKTFIKSQNKDRDMPSNQTEMYIHYLLIQTGLSHNKYQGKNVSPEDALIQYKELIKKLAALAYWKLKEQNAIFSKEDLRKYYITPDEALRYPGIITCVSECKFGYNRTKFFSFVHLSVQEFFAALFAFHEFLSGKQDALVLIQAKRGQKSNLSDFLKSVIDVTVLSKNEHLDLFNCFLFGISCDSSRRILEGFLPRLEDSSLEEHKKVTKYIKSLRRKDLSPERCFSLVRCIVELKDRSFLEMPDLECSRTKKPLTLFQCTLLAFRFVMSDTDHDEFVLRKFNITLEGFQRFSPAIKCFRKAMLKGSGFTEKHCDILVPFLTSPNSHLTHLDLSHNSLGLSALKQLSRAFCDPKCQIQMLNLSHNDLHSQDMEFIKGVLSGSNVNLKILDLSDNHLEDEGVKILSAGLRSAKCHLEVLKLSGCQIQEGILKLLSSLKASLRELDLQYNDLGNIMEKKVRRLKDKLPSLRIYTGGVCNHKPGLYKYAVTLTFDPQTAN
ncbi:NACHT, LRR and PYD domains-containing protein 3-like isoform X2 [Sinocyclocheilus anshuiensis]|uniref:NACHT, LRR and PYD domains-containing protein 3-like isoform X2 n=1 Tax=Sinocyclocheilus anshuiensis TaxID=1608454 RepID=UPI0007B9A162|nr:PREDICTED: NACHT, LRR and PYD domains-containing protein 3-like isoform X2 [Sinocyclocheilus anshuiensis]